MTAKITKEQIADAAIAFVRATDMYDNIFGSDEYRHGDDEARDDLLVADDELIRAREQLFEIARDWA